MEFPQPRYDRPILIKPQNFSWTADRKLPGQMRLRESTKTPLFNGALECRLFRFDLVTGSVKGPRQERVEKA